MDRESELALVARLRRGEVAAFDDAHAAFHARLFNFLARLARNRDVAEDLLEETWLRLVTRGTTLRDDTELGAWLFTVARNLYFSYCRSRALETGLACDDAGLWPAAAVPASPFEATAANETERRIERALASLPAAHREVLLLVAIEGMTPAEAAAICCVPAATLRQRLHRARALLLDRLKLDAPVGSFSRTHEVTS